MKKVKITVLKTDDWEAYYFDGSLVDQHHNVCKEYLLRELASRLGAGVEFESKWFDEDKSEFVGEFPANLPDNL